MAPSAIAEALFVSVSRGVPLVQALTDSGAVAPEVLARYLARAEAPVLRQVTPVPELVERLPDGLCARLFAVPVRRDAITGTVDVAVADALDAHPAAEIGHHLGAPVRVIRAPVAAIEEPCGGSASARSPPRPARASLRRPRTSVSTTRAPARGRQRPGRTRPSPRRIRCSPRPWPASICALRGRRCRTGHPDPRSPPPPPSRRSGRGTHPRGARRSTPQPRGSPPSRRAAASAPRSRSRSRGAPTARSPAARSALRR